jgi:cbb3-type cytochrome oxidase cytochrome c subunit
MRRGLVLRAVVVLPFLTSLLGPVSAQEPEGLVARGGRSFTSQGCYGCHLVGKYGTPIGPDLSRVGAKYPVSYLTRWLRDPESVRPTAHMPKLELTPEDIQGLAAYLGSLQ